MCPSPCFITTYPMPCTALFIPSPWEDPPFSYVPCCRWLIRRVSFFLIPIVLKLNGIFRSDQQPHSFDIDKFIEFFVSGLWVIATNEFLSEKVDWTISTPKQTAIGVFDRDVRSPANHFWEYCGATNQQSVGHDNTIVTWSKLYIYDQQSKKTGKNHQSAQPSTEESNFFGRLLSKFTVLFVKIHFRSNCPYQFISNVIIYTEWEFAKPVRIYFVLRQCIRLNTFWMSKCSNSHKRLVHDYHAIEV